jgi:hypothetical protein
MGHSVEAVILPDVAGLMGPPDFNSESAPGLPVRLDAIVVNNNNDCADPHVVSSTL